MSDDILLGREKEISLINSLMDKKENIIIFGQEGFGKSAILRYILANRKMSAILFSERSLSLRESLINLIASNNDSMGNIKGKNILSLKKAFYGILNKNPEYIVFDHIGRVEPKFYSFLTYLMDKNIPLLIISHGLDKQHTGHLRMALYDFKKVEIAYFNKAASNALVDNFIREYEIKLSKEADFKRVIFNYSKGNPKIIKALCLLARGGKYQKNDVLDVKLMDLDRRINEAVR